MRELPRPDASEMQDIVRKRNLGGDPEVQTFEDALCLSFLETQLGAFATAVTRRVNLTSAILHSARLYRRPKVHS